MKKYLATTTPNKFIKVELYYNKGGETDYHGYAYQVATKNGLTLAE